MFDCVACARFGRALYFFLAIVAIVLLGIIGVFCGANQVSTLTGSFRQEHTQRLRFLQQ